MAQDIDLLGVQARANAVQKMIVLGVQQGISSLPPTSGQSFLYEYDPDLKLYVRSKRLGPTAFRSPQTIGKGQFSLRVAGSYFSLGDTFGPITYEFGTTSGSQRGVTRLGVEAQAQTGLLNVGNTFGLLDWLEFEVNMPLVMTDVSASEVFFATPDDIQAGPPVEPAGVRCPPPFDLNACRLRFQSAATPVNKGGTGELRQTSVPFQDQNVEFNDGFHSGLGRINIGTKIDVPGALQVKEGLGNRVQFAFAPELYFPSPSEEEFAGSDTWAILPRFIASGQVIDFMQMLVDVGYDYDFDLNELRRFVWNTGLSFGFEQVSFDLGVGGSKFNEGITWTPRTAPAEICENQDCTQVAPASITKVRGAGNQLGSNFVDFLGGIKVRILENSVISGVVNVPLNDQGFRAEAYGTVAVEAYF